MSRVSFRNFHTPHTICRIRTASPVLISEPAVLSICDPQKLAGHGIGFDYTTHLKSKGEYLERFIAFRSLEYTHVSTINDMNLSVEAQAALLNALSETCSNKNLVDVVANHKFRTVDVHNLITHEPAQLPWVFFSLHASSDCHDFSYVPIRDTSGSSFHTDENVAVENALMEFIERQNLTAMWATRRCLAQDILQPEDMEDPHIQGLAQLLCRKGILYVYDISFLAGVETVFIVYKAKNSTDYVQFSCGSSSAFCRQSALRKALIETWQTGLLLLQMAVLKGKEYSGDQLKENFRQANSASFHMGIDVIPGTRPITSPSRKEVERSLAEVSPHIFFYKQHYVSGVDRGFFCKIFSPDFCVHMNPGEGNNNSNKWLKKVAQGRALRLENMPFA